VEKRRETKQVCFIGFKVKTLGACLENALVEPTSVSDPYSHGLGSTCLLSKLFEPTPYVFSSIVLKLT
jgi:hypothetical protein